jgi:aminoglycoside phosphotransferase family enzyme
MNPVLPALESKVAHLREPGSYPEPAYRVEAIETHMSWVFLLERHVYKLKKPVCHELLDFRSIDARQHFCQEELRLNRRLAPAVYLDVVALTLDEGGHLQLGGGGVAVDWLVKMARLPAHRMLDYMIAHASLAPRDLERLATHLARFYQRLAAEPIAPERYRAKLRRQIESNLNELSVPQYRLPLAQVRTLCHAQAAVLEQHGALLDARVAQGRIVEGHGDLRPEHICLDTDVAIIDCLEFARELRVLDMADELAFLALECERLGAPGIGAQLMRRCGDLVADAPAPMLVHLYQSCRASMRATIAARHMGEEKFRYSPHWHDKARQYLQLAQQHIECCR